MTMTPAEVMANGISHGACAEGLTWATGKDSDQVWATTDSSAAPFLFWWAVKNAGQNGWKTQAEVLTVLGQITEIACSRLGIAKNRVRFTLQNALIEPNLFFAGLVREVRGENSSPAFLAVYFSEILAVIKQNLEPSL